MSEVKTRRAIMEIVDHRERTSGEIAERLGLKPKIVSRNLQTLRDEGKVVSERIKPGRPYLGWKAAECANILANADTGLHTGRAEVSTGGNLGGLPKVRKAQGVQPPPNRKRRLLDRL